MTREEHLRWCKLRSLEYVDQGDLSNAMASMVSDLRKHEETKNHPGIEHGFMLMLSGLLNIPEKMREFIEGFY